MTCQLISLLGVVMVVVGWTFIIIFFQKRNHPETADAMHVERMMLGVIIETMGFLLLILGVSGSICAIT